MSAPILAGIVTWLLVMASALAICSDSKRREYDAAQRRHPANWKSPRASAGTHTGVDFTPATEAAIEQAIAIIDDDKRVVAEAERILRDEADA